MRYHIIKIGPILTKSVFWAPFTGCPIKIGQAQSPKEIFGLASKMKVYDLRNSYAKFPKFFIIPTIVTLSCPAIVRCVLRWQRPPIR